MPVVDDVPPPMTLPAVLPTPIPMQVLTAGSQDLANAVLQDMREAFQAQRDAWKTINMYYQKKLLE